MGMFREENKDNKVSPDQTDKRRERSKRTRENLLTAAMHCYRIKGVSRTAMEDVAQQAGVGRATLYRHFKNQESLLSEVMALNLEELNSVLAQSMQDCQEPEDYFVEAAVVIIRECKERGLTDLLFGDEGSSSVINRISFSDPRITTMGKELIAPFYKHARDQNILRDWVTKPLLLEWTSRLLLSFLITPSPLLDTEKKLRNFFKDAVMASIIDRS